MLLENYKHQIQIQVRFVDIDRLNHVNNSCYLSYFELGRVSYFNQVLNTAINWNKNGFILARTEIDHLEPIVLTDEVTCYTRVSKIGNKSLTIENSITKKSADGKPIKCAVGLGILVAMDYVNNLSMEIPVTWRDLILRFEH